MIEFHSTEIDKNTIKYINDVVKRNSFNDQGKYYQLCKEFLLNYTKAKAILLTHSATTALEIAHQILTNKNDKVVLPSFTFSSTANSVLKSGAKIDWLEISENDLCVDLHNVKNLKLIQNSKVVTPVHYGSSAANMNLLLQLTKKSKTEIIEDAAQSLGVFIGKKHVGTFGKFGIISFHNTKFIHAGFGGALLINDLNYYDEAVEIYNRGTNRHLFQKGLVNKYNWTKLGTSGGNSDLNFAVLFSQLEVLDEIIEKRKKIFQYYNESFTKLSNHNVGYQSLNTISKSNYSSYYLLVDNKKTRDNLINFLKQYNIPSQFHYIPLHSSPMGQQYTTNRKLSLTDKASETLIRLPIHTKLTKSQQKYIVNKVFEYFKLNSI